MPKVTLPDIGTLGNPTTARASINNNLAAIEEAFDNTLSRDGTGPNNMAADLDMDSNKITNVADPEDEGDAVNMRSIGPLVAEYVAGLVEESIQGTARVDEFTATAGQTEFELSDSPAGNNAVYVFDNGLAMVPGTDFTLTGDTLQTLEFFVGRTLGHTIVARYVQLAPADSLVRADLLSTASGKGSDMIIFTQTGSGSVERTQQSKSRELLSALDKIPVSEHAAIRAKTSTLDVTSYINQALTEASASGRDVFLPSGKYKLTSGLAINEGSDTDDYNPRAALIGEGPSNSILEFGAGAYNGLTIQGGTGSGSHSNIRTGGFSLQKTDRLGTAIFMDNCAFAATRDVFASGWQYGIRATDCLTGEFERLTIRNCDYGMQAEYANGSYPNAMTFLSCEFGVNKYSALNLFGAGSVTFYGGAIEGNGWVGGGVGYGIYIEDSGAESGVGLAMHGTYIEANEGVADIWIKNTAGFTRDAAHSFNGCSFARINNTNYVTNNVRIENLSPSRVVASFQGCAFKRFNTYVANAARQYINKINSSTGSVYINRSAGNYYSDAVENAELSGISDSEMSLPIALGRWTVAGAVVTSVATKNVQGIVRNGAGDYTVTLQEGASTMLPAAFITAGTTDYTATCRALTSTTIQIYTRNSAGALSDPSGFSLLVHAVR